MEARSIGSRGDFIGSLALSAVLQCAKGNASKMGKPDLQDERINGSLYTLAETSYIGGWYPLHP